MLGITTFIDKVSVELIAAHPGTGETDIACLVWTNLPPSHFGENGLYASLQRVKMAEAREFATRHSIVYATAAILEKVGSWARKESTSNSPSINFI